MKFLSGNLILFFILLFFLLTRFYQIGSIPASLYWDEASIGYNAYSIAVTGRDEWGKFFPLHFRAFGEFKLPVYIYSVAVLEKFLGSSDVAVRLPAVLFSLGTVVLTYLLAGKIFGKKTVALMSAFFLALSPWFFIFSRTGYEATAGLMFYLGGIYFFLLSGKNRIYLLFTSASFILSLYSYNSFRIITPLTLALLAGFAIRSKDYFIKRLTGVGILSLVIFLLSLVPIIRLTLSEGVTRFRAVEAVDSSYLQNYLSHFSPAFLWISGDQNLRSQAGGHGQLSWLDLPLLALGLFFVFREKKPLGFLGVALVLFAPIPAAITKESPHALRSLSGVPFLAMLSAAGVEYLREKIYFRRLLASALVISALLLFGSYYRDFLTNYPALSAGDWQYGYRAVFTGFKNQFRDYDRVVVSDYLAQPYIFALYYLQYDPSRFLAEVQYNPPDKWGFSTVSSFGNFSFRPAEGNHLPAGRTLVFASPREKLDNEVSGVIKNPDGSIAFNVYRYQK